MLAFRPYVNNTIYLNDAIAGIVVGIVAAIGVCALVTGIALFVFRALSVFKIARRRGISNAWLAWVPVCSDWILGSVADQYQYVVKGRIKNRRLPLFLLSVVLLGLRIVGAALSVSVVTYVARFVLTGVGFPDAGRLALLAVVSTAQMGGMIAYLVIRSFVLYDVYTSCTSRNNVLFLVLSVLFRVLEPVFLFACRNKEEGMPPRREVTVEEPADQTEERSWTEE